MLTHAFRCLILLLLMALPPMAGAAEPVIFPTPQKCEWSGGYTQAHEVRVAMGKHESLPDVSGAYRLEISADGTVDVLATDEAGLFYAKQTLSQLLQGVDGAQDAQRDPFPDMDIAQVAALGGLPVGTVVDWPALPFRGVVEGYYGRPWTHADRRSLFDFFGRNKLNIYIYAPKDDPYHHGQGCYEPYPPEKAAEIADFVQQARRNHVRLVWAIHPANTVNWQVDDGRNELEGLCRKLEFMYSLGVRDFAVLVDDNEGEIIRPARQAQLCNYILEHFIHQHPDVNQTLIMCPSHYCKYWAPAWFLKILGEGLDPSIQVMWTGDTVVHDINLPGQQWVHQTLGRPTFVWWNWPCNDFKRNRLSMGKAHGLDTAPEMAQEMAGFVANPMELAEASKVGLFCVADYTWNPATYTPDAAWHAGIARLYPSCADAMQTFCNHASHLQPGDDGFDHEESTAVAPAAASLQDSLASGRVDAASAAVLRGEFGRISAAAQTLATTPGLDALRAEISPWLHAFTLLGEAGVQTMDLLEAPAGPARLAAFLDTLDALMALQDIPRTHWMSDGSTKVYHDVQVGSLILHPTLVQCFHAVGAQVYQELSGRPSPRVTARFSAKTGGELREVIYMTDGDEKTWWPCGCDQSAGDWYCWDFGQPVEIRTVTLILGAAERTDYAVQGQLEYSDDGILWRALGGCDYDCRILRDLTAAPLTARYLRYRVIQPKHNWLAINEFGINHPLNPTPAQPMLDADFLTHCDCDAGLDMAIPVPAGATELFVVGNADCRVSGTEGELLHRNLRRFPLPPGTTEIRLSAPASPSTRIHELIFN